MTIQPPLIDSHCHLNMLELADFDNNMDIVIQKAHESGVQHMLCVCCELTHFAQLRQLAETYSQVSISVGIHPNTILDKELDTAALIELAEHPACIAIGETGLDYYRTETTAAQQVQKKRFCTHIEASLSSGKPLIIHTRQAADDTIALLKSERASEIGGVMHCFSENWEVAKKALDLNFYISFSGIVTFKNATVLQEVAKKVPLDRILIETDSPYLAPVPYRGKQNHPALVKHVAMALSELRQVDYQIIAKQTTENFYHCFRVNKP